MKNIILDIETIPQSAESLEAMMPQEVAKPQMPEDIANPVEPEWAAKVPRYNGNEARQTSWILANTAKWEKACEAAKAKWQQQTLDARARFVESAALRAESGHVKMIGLSVNSERTIYLWEPDRKIVDVAEKESARAKVALFAPFMKEGEMLKRFAKDFVPMIGDEVSDRIECEGVGSAKVTYQDGGMVITFYGNTFDLPFIARRAAICGDGTLLKFLRKNRRGRYLDSKYFVDLHEEWTMGDRETKTGGLAGLAKMLGIEMTKAGDGATFYQWWKTDPAEGIRYLLNDLSLTEQCAQRMGLI